MQYRSAKHNLKNILLVTVGAAALSTSVSFANEKEEERDGFELQEIIVTANKRQETLFDTAGTVNVITGANIDQLGSTNLEDLLRQTPGAVLQKGEPDNSVVIIRGVGTDTIVEVNQTPTGAYIGDVPISDPFVPTGVADPATYDLQSVEILKGPQGVLYGTASLAGAIRYQFARPEFTGFSGEVGLEMNAVKSGELGYGGHAVLNVAEEDSKIGARFVGFYREDGGYIDNLGTGDENANDFEQYGGRAVIVANATENLTLTGIAHYQKSTSFDSFGVNLPINDLQTSDRVGLNLSEREFLFTNFVVDWEMDWATMTSSTAYQKKKAFLQQDFTGFANELLLSNQFFALLPPPFNALFNPNLPAATTQATFEFPSDSRSFSQEIRFASNPDNDSRFSWVFGGFFQDFKIDADGAMTAVGVDDVLVTSATSTEAQEYAVFADIEYDITDRLSLGLGGRYYKSEVDATLTLGTVLTGPPTTTTAPASDDGFAPRASLEFAASDNFTTYIRYSRGFRFGGANVIPPAAPPTPASPPQFESDSLDAYEIGLRARTDSGFFGEAAVFYYDWSGAQVTIDRGDSFEFIDNVGSASVTGVEVILGYRTEDLDISTSVTFSDSQLTEDFTPAIGTTIADGTGLPGSPDFQSYTTATYNFDNLAGMTGFINVNHSYVGEYTTELVPTDPVAGARLGGAYHQLNASFGLDVRSNIQLLFHARNITNDIAELGGAAVASSFVPGQNILEQFFTTKPRSFTVELKAEF